MSSTSRKGLLSKLLILGLVLVVIGGGLVASYHYLLKPPVVLGDGLAIGQIQKIDISAPIKISFSHSMDQGSVERAFHVSPALKGVSHWEGNTFIFTPAPGSVQANKQYSVWIDASAQDIFRKQLQTSFYQQFETAGPPQVIMHLPEGIADKETSPITVVFDRPMVPVTTLGATSNLGGPLKIEPNASGTYKWLGTNTVQFIPDRLLPATTYKVSVPKGITDLYGAALAQDVVWQFDTLHPAILYTYPPDLYKEAGFKTEVSIRFNQKMDQHSLEQNIDWQTTDAKQKIAYILKLDSAGTQVTLTPNALLPKASDLTVIIHQGLKSAEGKFPLEKDYKWLFSTVGDPKVVSSTPTENSHQPYNYGVDINFTNPMVSDDIDQYVVVEPKIEHLLNTMEAYDEGLRMHISGDFLPSTKYKVTIKGNWPDKFGQKLGQDFVLNFETEQLPSDIAFIGRQRFGLIDGYRAKFEQVLQAINVSKANLSLYKLSREDLWQKYFVIRGNGYYDQSSPSFGQLQKSWPIDSPNPLNQVVQLPVDLTNQVQNSGIYTIRVASKDLPSDEQTFMISKTALLFKAGADQALVWATDMKSGLPVTNMQIEIQDGPNHTVVSGVTDQNGLFSADWPQNIRDRLQSYDRLDLLVFGSKDADLAITGNDYVWNQGIEPWQFHISTGWVEKMRSYVLTDRPLYLPGQQVFWKAMARAEVDGKYQLLPPNTEAHVTVTNNQGEQIVKKNITLDEHSTVQDSFTLANDAPIGSYYLEVNINGQIATGYFQVQEYKKPLFKLDLSSEKPDYVQGEEAKATVDARYFFGSSLPNAKVHYRVTSDDYFFSRYEGKDKEFAFTDYDTECFYCDWQGRSDKTRVEDTGFTDNNGRFVWTIPTKFTDEKESQIFNVDVEVKDPSTQEVVWSSMQFVVHKSDTYVGITSDSYLVKQNETASFSVVTTNILGNPVPNISGQVSLLKRTYKTIKKKGVDGFFYYDSSFDDQLVKTVNFVSGSDGQTRVSFTIADGGDYHVVATVKDNQQHEAKAATNISVSSDQYVSWGRENNDRMEIIPDKKSYTLGETAKLIVKSPYAGVKALLTIERNNIIEKRVVDLPTTATVLDIPLKDEYLPNVFASVVAVKGYGADNTPAFKVGYVNLRIDNQARALKIVMKPDRPIYHPKDVVNVAVTVTDQSGKPRAGDFAFAVVDESLLAITGENRDDILERFFGQRSLVVQTFDSLVTLIERIDVKKGSGSKGGDGNDALKKRSNFKDTAYFNAHVVTNADGKANVQFTLPDNITTWQLWMVGSTDDTYVGSEKIDMVARKDVFVETLIPQFLVEGDQAQVGALVQNLTDRSVSGQMSLTVQQATLADKSEQSLSVGANDKNKAYWTINVPEHSDHVTVRYTFKNDQYEDIVEKTIPVYPYWTKQTVSFGNVVHDKTMEEIVLPLGTIQDQGELKVNVATSLLDLSKNILPQYGPSDFYRDTHSRATILLIGGLFKQIEVQSGQSSSSNVWVDSVPSALQEIYSLQRGDGGFSYWQGDLQSDPYISTVVLEALQIVAKQYNVDSGVEQRLRDYLTGYYNNTELVLPTDVQSYVGQRRQDAENQIKRDADSLAYVANVLGADPKHTLSLQHILDHKDQLSLWGQAELAMAAHQQKRDDIASSLKQTIENKILTTSTQAHFEEEWYDPWTLASPIRTNEAILRMYFQLNGDERVQANLIRYILRSRDRNYFDSNAELIDWLKVSVDFLEAKGMNKNVNWSLALNGENLPQKTTTTESGVQGEINVPLQKLKGEGGINALTFDHTGTGALFYEGTMSYQVAGLEASPVTQGMGIYREYNKLTDLQNKQAITSAKVGEDVKVTLTIVVPEDRYHVAVEDFLPAGLSAYNVQLNQVSPEQDRLLREWQKTNPPKDNDPMADYYPDFYPVYWQNQEIRADRVAAFASYLPKGVYQFSYLAHTTTPGNYKVRPARVSEQFFPDVFGATGAGQWQVLP